MGSTSLPGFIGISHKASKQEVAEILRVHHGAAPTTTKTSHTTQQHIINIAKEQLIKLNKGY